jgi:hypothetical protein
MADQTSPKDLITVIKGNKGLTAVAIGAAVLLVYYLYKQSQAVSAASTTATAATTGTGIPLTGGSYTNVEKTYQASPSPIAGPSGAPGSTGAAGPVGPAGPVGTPGPVGPVAPVSKPVTATMQWIQHYSTQNQSLDLVAKNATISMINDAVKAGAKQRFNVTGQDLYNHNKAVVDAFFSKNRIGGSKITVGTKGMAIIIPKVVITK